MGSTPDLSVVIVTYNADELIVGCLDSLREDAEAAELSLEVFVVDSASRDDTTEVIRSHHPWVRLIASEKNLGFSAGNNEALPKCTGRFVALLNPDSVIRSGALERLLGVLGADDSIGAVGPKLILADGSTQLESARNLPTLGNMWPWLALLDKLRHAVLDRGVRTPVDHPPPPPKTLDGFNLLWWERDRSCDASCLSGACMVMRREVVDRIGLLDEASPLYLDDMDYCKRIRDAGWRLRYVAEAEVTHLWEASTAPLRRQGDFYALQCHAVWLYLRKHHGPRASLAFSAVALAAVGFRAAVCGTASMLGGPRSRAEWRRRLAMTRGLFRWARRFPKRAPRFGFAYEQALPGGDR